MSLFSRLFGKSAPKPAAAAPATPAPAPAPKPARPDPAVTALAEEASVAQAITAGDLGEVSRWVVEGSSTRVRQMAARAVTAPEQLDRLIPAVRGKDKNVYRILAAKREELLAVRRAAEQRQAEIADAAAALARHGQRPYDVSYATTLARLEARWSAVATDATPEQQVEMTQVIVRAHELVEAQRLAIAAEAERQQAAALAAEQARRDREQAAQVAAEAATAQAELAETERRAEQARREAGDAQVRELLGLLRQAQAAVEHGGTARAVRLRDSIRQKLPQAPALPAWFERKLQDVETRLGELQDWRTFTVVPKRAELVQRMQALVGADMSPEELAKQIRRVRDEWRTVHRGAGDEPTPEREQFEQAAQQAYEPCREHFARQAEQRKQNQARREELLERLAAFAAEQSGESPDWRAVQRAIVESRREWREYAPVDQEVAKPLQARLHAALDDLQARLDAEYARNVQAKRTLIERVAALATIEDTRQAVDSARDLQQAWKAVGFVPRHQDDALWAEFRGHCDAVFERSSQARASRDAALDANHARAVALCEEVEALVARVDTDVGVVRKRLEEIRTEFDALELPRASVRDLRRRLGVAIERVEEAVHRQRERVARNAWVAVFAAHAPVRAYALAVARGSEDRNDRLAAATAAVAAVGDTPKDARSALERQLAGVTAGTVDLDPAANAATLRLLCVRAELLAGLASPPQDLELRREHQMQRLVEAMGRGERPGPGATHDLALEWLAVGPVEPVTYEPLHERFVRALDLAPG
ncbi:MAG TPA: DUF349 domain-containing protein [Steroidobacteraceae bacterium]|nr:DUF349 domain-containing protein [Steroidobacteraceae bacterium]